MKNYRLFLILGITLGLTRVAHATCTGTNDPCIDPGAGSITSPGPTSLTMTAQNSSNATTNPHGTIFNFQATTFNTPQSAATPDGKTQIILASDLFNPPSATDPITTAINPLLFSTIYHGFVNACPAGTSGNPSAPGCSAWVSLGSLQTSDITNNGFDNIAPGDTQVQQFTARTNNQVADQSVGDVNGWILTQLASTEVGNCSLNNVLSPFPLSGNQSLSVVAANCSTLLPNRPYTLTENLVYKLNQTAPSYTTTVFYTQAQTPHAGSVSGITHCSATLSFSNASASPANPADTNYLVSGGGASASKVIGGTGIFSDANSVVLTGLPDGTLISDAKVIAKNRGGSTWRDSAESDYAPFTTIAFSATGNVTSITPTTAQYTVTIGNTTGLISYQIYLNGAPFGSVQSFTSSPITVTLTGLTPGSSNNTASIKLTEASCTSGFTASFTFNTPNSLGGSIAFTDHGTNVDMTVTGSGANPPYTYSNWHVISGPSGTNFNSTTGATVNMTYTSQGSYQIGVTVTDSLGATANVTGTFSPGQTPTKISISPSTSTVLTGSNQLFKAIVCDQLETGTCDANSTHIISGQTVNWSVTGGGTPLTQNGTASYTYNATTPGSYTLTASVGSATPGTAAITVASSGFTVTNGPSFTVDVNHKTGTATVRANFNNVPNDPNTVYFWSVASGPGVISFTPNNNNSARDTVLGFTKAGTYFLQVKMSNSGQSLTATTPSGTVPQDLTSIKVCPTGMSTCDPTVAVVVKALQDQQFTPNEFDQFGDPLATPLPVTWLGGGVNSAGVFNSNSLGSQITITAKNGNVSGSALVSVISFDVSAAYAYPVPYKASQGGGFIHFTGLGSQSTIHIYTSSGRRVFDISLTSNTYDWPIKNSSGENIASGVYSYVIESPEGKKNGKLIIIQ